MDFAITGVGDDTATRQRLMLMEQEHTPPTVLEIYHMEASAIGGAATSIYYFLQALDRQRYCPILLCHTPGKSESRFSQLGIPLLYHPMPRYLHIEGEHAALNWRKWRHLLSSFFPDPWLAHAIREHSVRLVHLHSVVQFSAALTCRLMGVPVVWHVRESLHHGFFGLRRWILKSAIRNWSSAIICISEDEARLFDDLGKTHVIYNSLDFSVLDAVLARGGTEIRERLGLDPATVVIGISGAIDRVKGIYDFVEAAAQVVQHTSRTCKFIVIGPSHITERYERSVRDLLLNRLELGRVDGQTEMQRLIREKNLQSDFIFVGPQDSALEYMAAMDIVLCPSHLPALGRPVFEASALGKPVIATSQDRRTRIIADGKTGLLVPPRDPARLANAILRLLANPAESAEMGRAGYAYAREHFDHRRNAEKIMAVYDQVLASKTR